MKRYLLTLSVIVIAAALILGFFFSGRKEDQELVSAANAANKNLNNESRLWLIRAGAANSDNSVVTSKFYPEKITINVGDSITWVVIGDAHTITFLSGKKAPSPLSTEAAAPVGGNIYNGTGVVSSGILNPQGVGKEPHTYTLTFTKAGTYIYDCLIHQGSPGMKGVVVVNPIGSKYPETQEQYNNQESSISDTELGKMQSMMNDYTEKSSVSPDGTKNYIVSVGLGDGIASTMRFLPQNLTINVGDTVTWKNSDPIMIHTVTFPGKDGKYPDFPSTEAINPSGGNQFDGTLLTGSGVIYPMGAPDSQFYTLKFVKSGTYQYQCVIHDDMGMKGTIIVRGSS